MNNFLSIFIHFYTQQVARLIPNNLATSSTLLLLCCSIKPFHGIGVQRVPYTFKEREQYLKRLKKRKELLR